MAFCVGVQAEDVDCLPSPKVSNEDPALSTTASPTPYSGGAALWRIHSRGIRAPEGRAFTTHSTSGVEANISQPHPPLQPHRPGGGIQIPDGRRNPGPPPSLCPEVLSTSPHVPSSPSWGPRPSGPAGDAVKLCFLIFLLCPGDHLHRLPPDPSSELRERPLPPAWLPSWGQVCPGWCP